MFYAILETLRNFGTFSVLAPFLLAFTISFAVMEKMKLFSNNKKYHIIISLIFGFLTASSMQVSSAISSFIEKLGLGLIVMIGIMLILGIFGFKASNKGAWIGGLVFLAVLYFQFANESVTIFLKDLLLSKYAIIAIASILTFWWIVGFPTISPSPTTQSTPQSKMVTSASDVIPEFRPHLKEIGRIPGKELG